MKRNRSLRTLPLENLTILQHPPPESVNKCDTEDFCFGEEISKDSFSDDKILLSSDDSDIILSNVRDLSNKSSSSSLSWGEEAKTEVSRQIQYELERMDRVLMGVESIPDYYDREEYKEWMEFFPSLCILGKKTGSLAQIPNVTASEEIFAIHPETACDNFKTKYKKPVIPRKDVEVDRFLKVSSIGGARLARRQSSSKSLISSQISSSKWLKEEEYSSLPFLEVKNYRAVPRSILKNTLVLPPIEPPRAASATPRRESKSLSALSVKEQKYSGFKRKPIHK